MNPPVSDAIQGAYVVAAIMTGLILGGAAIVFKEMTEGLGCLLGGFCFSMWLLVLKPGGLLTSTGAISGFIAAFTLAGFATSFSHITRPYGLMVLISFAGATAVVLGIDCFSRAGLKEFWAYLWKLNDTLFPLGATTYPLTRGLRVEIAAIIIIFLAGIVSQMKLWKVVKERREQRVKERLEDERTMAQEEETVGRRIEQHNAQDRNQWEAVYGDKDAAKSGEQSIIDSGVGDMDSQKKGPLSTVTSLRRSGENEIEMAEMSPTQATGVGLVMSNNAEDGAAVTVRVARDLEPPQILDENGNPIKVESSTNRLSHVSMRSSSSQKKGEEQLWDVSADEEARLEKRSSQCNSKRTSGGLEVVPLPFKVPEGDIEDDRSSVATFADDEQAGQKRFSHRLSATSAILRKLSKRSQRGSKRFSNNGGNSTEDLVIPHAVEDDRASSIAATMDGLSDDDRSVRTSMEPSREALGIEHCSDRRASSIMEFDFEVPDAKAQKHSSLLTIGTEILEPAATNEVKTEEAANQKSLTSHTDPKPVPDVIVSPEAPSNDPEKQAPPSVASVVDAKPASITKDRLPAQLSKVIMSYRTNEWAKHLGGAEAPDLDKLEIAPMEAQTTTAEAAAPVNVEELQQTPENALPPPARSMSQMSNHAPSPLTRSGSAMSQHSIYGQQSQPSLNTRVSTLRSVSSPNIPQPIVESPIEEDLSPGSSAVKNSSLAVPFSSSNTLMGKRDSILRNKSYISNPSTLASTPEFSSLANSEAGSVYNYPNASGPIIGEDENMTLSARRDLIRQSSLQSLSNTSPLQQTPIPFDSHQPRRQTSAAHPLAREQQLASWRASVHNEFQSTAQPRQTIERQRSALWQERQAEEQKKAFDTKRRGERDIAFDQRMRRGDMLDAHREALRKMQASANKHA